jgi:hypothetical protein
MVDETDTEREQQMNACTAGLEQLARPFRCARHQRPLFLSRNSTATSIPSNNCHKNSWSVALTRLVSEAAGALSRYP